MEINNQKKLWEDTIGLHTRKSHVRIPISPPKEKYARLRAKEQCHVGSCSPCGNTGVNKWAGTRELYLQVQPLNPDILDYQCMLGVELGMLAQGQSQLGAPRGLQGAPLLLFLDF